MIARGIREPGGLITRFVFDIVELAKTGGGDKAREVRSSGTQTKRLSHSIAPLPTSTHASHNVSSIS